MWDSETNTDRDYICQVKLNFFGVHPTTALVGPAMHLLLLQGVPEWRELFVSARKSQSCFSFGLNVPKKASGRTIY